MKKSARWVVFISILTLVAGFLTVGPVMVMAEGEGAPATADGSVAAAASTPIDTTIDTTGMVPKGNVTAVVWDDVINPDGQFPLMEGVNGITVELYIKDKDNAWKLYGSQVTSGTYGLVSWANLPVVEWKDFSKPQPITYYKLKLVDATGDTIESLNGIEREAGLCSTNVFIRDFINTKGELAAFQIKYLKPWPTTNDGKVEAIVWDDAIIEEVMEPKQEGINGITVELYRQVGDSWVSMGAKQTGAGWTFPPVGVPEYVPYGRVGWNELPVHDPRFKTNYKMVLRTDGTFEPLNGTERVFSLDSSDVYYRWFFEVDGNLNAFQVDAISRLPVVNEGFIEAVVWDDGILEDTTDSCSEGINGITVELYSRDLATGEWKLYGSKVTGAGGFTKLVPYGWVGWNNLPVVDDLRVTTLYKLVLVEDGRFNDVNGVERVARLNSSNKLFRWFFEVSDDADLRAFEIRSISALPVENIGRIEAMVWDDAVLPKETNSRMEGVDDIIVNLYKKDENGEWQFYDSQSTHAGGFIWRAEHGWVGWDSLPVTADLRVKTYYKLEIVTDQTFNPVGSTERIISLDSSNLWYRWYFEVADSADLQAFRIQSTTVLISGTVWHDMNANLARDFYEPTCEGWTVMLTDRYGRKVATKTTNKWGYYQFRGLKPGTYKVWVKDARGWNQTCPFYKLCTWPPYGYNKGHYVVNGQAGKYYINKNFGMLDMDGTLLAPVVYSLWWIGLLAYQLVP
jgi:hypothetical protein